MNTSSSPRTLDHLGIGDPVNGDNIYNGAGDNASGTAALHRNRAGIHPDAASLLAARFFFSRSPAKKKACWAPTTTPTIRRCRSRRSSPTSTWTRFPSSTTSRTSCRWEASTPAWARWRTMWPATWVCSKPGPVARRSLFRPQRPVFVRRARRARALHRRRLQTVNPNLDGKKMQIDWETTRYHLPSDDMNQPFDFNATGQVHARGSGRRL